MSRLRRLPLTAVAAAVAALTVASPAVAGPPLLCHPFDIGSASSLPWSGRAGWFAGRDGYEIANLGADTEALLTPATPVIVRLETLRRAAIYASRDGRVAARLLSTLRERAERADRTGRPDALAYLDAAYLTEALRQIAQLDPPGEFRGRGAAIRQVIGEADGYALVMRSLAARPDDPSLEFAAALIAAGKNRAEYRAAYEAHAARARAGAERDALLARNIRHVSSS